jgi:uncharacterized protein (TIGR00725 family)
MNSSCDGHLPGVLCGPKYSHPHMPFPPRRYVAVCGQSDPHPEREAEAEEVGRRLAEAGALVVGGGLGCVNDAAARGAAQAGGTVVGLLPGEDRREAAEHVTIALATGLGQGRNLVIVTAADAVIAIGRGWGTLTEIAHARRAGKRVIALHSWEVAGLETAATPAEAVARALADE